MKYKTRELLNMPQEDIYSICKGDCETRHCLFKKSLRDCREDGFCVADTFRFINGWIQDDESTIKHHYARIEVIKERIKKYKKWRRKILKDLETNNENTEG